MKRHTWDDGDCDAQPPAVFDKLEEAVHVVEQLRDDDLCPSLNLQNQQQGAHEE